MGVGVGVGVGVWGVCLGLLNLIYNYSILS